MTVAETPAEQGTEYVVLVRGLARDVVSEGPSSTVDEVKVWRTVGEAYARSADSAIRAAVGRLPEGDRKGTFVAIPSRSFKPVTVSERVERTLVIGS